MDTIHRVATPNADLDEFNLQVKKLSVQIRPQKREKKVNEVNQNSTVQMERVAAGLMDESS